MTNLLSPLYDIYVNHEPWHKTRLDKDTFFRYTQKLIDTGNIFYAIREDRLVGYTEVWRLNYAQWGRLCCQETIAASDEDVQTGKIACVANVFIFPEWRHGEVVKELRDKYFEFTKECDYHVGEARRKKHQPISVYKTSRR